MESTIFPAEPWPDRDSTLNWLEWFDWNKIEFCFTFENFLESTLHDANH